MSSAFAFSVRHTLVPVVGCNLLFPVRRVYCVGQNYADHAKEMGGTVSKTNPFFFTKPTDAIVTNDTNHTTVMEINAKYPPQTENYQHEVELVVAIGPKHNNNNNNNNNNNAGIKYSALLPKEVHNIIYGYAVGLDMTRRDLQLQAKTNGKPWDLAKGAEESAPLSAIVPVASVQKEYNSLFYTSDAECKAEGKGENVMPAVLRRGAVKLTVNDTPRQEGNLSSFVTPIDELISILSHSVDLAPGDLVFTGTPSGVSAVKPGDVIKASVEGVGEITAHIYSK
ncbi:Fumarylacetoacetase-like [Trypanosoma melophagium]|uniref:Fumarylacetoacetase-like n=1 Tax=Trypanosoma melophagium TaxID=715481 RepID=UPI003519F7F8|nr:Fumarylacetoacetase-like [Trypanosoma melophagium]